MEILDREVLERLRHIRRLCLGLWYRQRVRYRDYEEIVAGRGSWKWGQVSE